MNNEQYINQLVIDYKGEKASIVSLDDEHVVIKQNNELITYNTQIAFKNKALVFVNEELNKLMHQQLNAANEIVVATQQKLEKTNKEAIKRNAMAHKKYCELEKKEKYLRKLFGHDFIYPPFVEFKKKYPYIKRKKTQIELMLEDVVGTIARTYKSN